MWTNQDQMFADEPETREEDKNAIEFLDHLACRIADGDVEIQDFNLTTNSSAYGLIWSDPIKKLEVIYQ